MNRSKRSSLPESLGRAALVLVSLLVTLCALEIAARVWRGTLSDWSNAVVEARRPEKVDGGLTQDATLGSIGTPNFAKTLYHHDADGYRRMPSMEGAPAVLAVGDSFTYGLEVGDDQTWPAYLQGLLHAGVVNAGVPGYGLDQDVLRVETLAATLKPARLVVSFIADDIRRLEMSRLWGREKPYFELSGGALELRHVPVPPNPVPGSLLPWWEHWIGWSALADMLRVRLVDDEAEYFRDHARALPRGAGETLVCPLMQRLARVGVPTLVVAQYAPRGWEHAVYGIEARRLSRHVLDCAAKAGLQTLDLFDVVDQTVRAGGLTVIYGAHAEHQSAAGNRFTAEQIAAKLRP